MDPEKVKEKIRTAQKEKHDETRKNIDRLKNFRMPKSPPKFGTGGTEKDLEK